jgi:hypothetical protein
MTNVWLVIDRANRGASWWRDQVRKRVRTGEVLVMQVSPTGWSGFGPKGQFRWLHTSWRSPPKLRTKEPSGEPSRESDKDRS